MQARPPHDQRREIEHAIAHLQSGRMREAALHIRRALALAPGDADPMFLLGLTASQLGSGPEPAYRRTLALASGHLAAAINLAGWLAAEGRASAARSALKRIIVQAPDMPQALGNLALASRGSEPPATSVRRLQRVLALLPGDAGTLLNLGSALDAAGENEQAVAAMRAAIRAEPALAAAHHGLAVELQKLPPSAQPFDEVRAALHRACALDPSFPAAWSSIAAVDPDDARAARLLGRALSVDPRLSQALGTLATLLRRQGKIGIAARLRRGLVALEPGVARGLNNLASSAIDHGEADQAVRCYRRALAADPGGSDIHSNLLFCLSYDPTLTNAALFEEYRRWERRHAVPLYALQRPHAGSLDPERRLRVGYVSADLRDHAIAWLAEGLFAAHDPVQVEPFSYAEVVRPDAMTERLQRLVPSWRSTVGLSDAAAADMIRADGVDLLVFLAGHTAGNRMRIAALKPAPVQVNLHNLSTSGLATVDYWLTDRALHPPGTTSEGMTERLIRVPSLYQHALPSAAPEPGPLPARANGFVTFGSFSNPAKINARVIALWASILRAMPMARLALSYLQAFADASVQGAFRRRFDRHGVADRVLFHEGQPERVRHLARIRALDVALDPFPFNGGITTFESLWMGVPVVTLAGQRFAARGGVSHLHQVGLGELVAADESEYRRIACSLASDLDRLAAMRATLRRRVEASPLADPVAYARNVEAAYRGMWREHCSARR